MDAASLSRADWLRAARLALLHHGRDGVRVEPLARALGVTKGSFYWHFTNRQDLLDALLEEWEQEPALLFDGLEVLDLPTALERLFEELHRRTIASERGDSPSDAAMFAWAAVDDSVAPRVHAAERARIRAFQELTGEPELALLLYYSYHGLVMRRRRVPSATADFAVLARLAQEILLSWRRPAATPRTRTATQSSRRRRT